MSQTAAAPVHDTDLSRLLQAEREAAAALAAARAEADDVVEAARRRATQREAVLTGELEEAARSLESAIQADRDARCAALAETAAKRAAAWDGFDPARIGRLADGVIAALLDESLR